MFLRIVTTLVGKVKRAPIREVDLSRRQMLAGLSAFGALAVGGSMFLPTGEAGAAVPPAGPAPAAQPDDVVLVQRRRDEDDDDDNRRSDGVSGRSYRRDDRDRRGDRGRDRGRNRMSRREIRTRCRESRRFRRDNRSLCQRAEGRGRRGECVQIGPVLLCD